MNPEKTGRVSEGAKVKAISEDHDTWLTTRAKIVLLTTEGIGLKDAEVETSHGVVTLQGQVETGAQRARAGLAVRSIDGVQGVRNFLKVDVVDEAVTSEPMPSDEVPSDEVLKKRVELALKSDEKLEGVKVAGVNDGVVHMSGQGVTMTGRLRAVELAWNATAASEREDDGRSQQDENQTNKDKGENK